MPLTPDERFDLVNLRGKYALDEDEMYDAIEILALSYGEEATRKIARAWSRKAAASGREVRNRQLKLF